MIDEKKILLIGDLENTYLRGFITRFLQPCGFVVDVKTEIYTREQGDRCDRIATELGINLIEKREARITKKLTELQKIKSIKPVITALKGLLYFFYKVNYKIHGEYNFVHVHYLYYEILRNAWRYKTENTKMVASWWGSDLFRKSDDDLEKCWRYLKDFSLVTTDSIDLEKAYFGRVVKGRESESVYRRLYLGSEVADCIDLQINNISRELDGRVIDDKVIIAIGYNASKAQQHQKVIEALSNLSVEKKSQIIVLLQMTYGIEDEDYPEKIVSFAKMAGFEVIWFKHYLSNKEVANIRRCTDIFINAQTTDAFCSTIKEYMYARTTLVNASWLEYEELKEWGLKTEIFDDFGEIKDIVDRIMFDRNSWILEKNREVIGEKFGWDGCAEKWRMAYEEV